MQSISLACGIRVLRRTSLSDYALICDIDEFWFPVDFSTPIEKYLTGLPSFDQVSFNWAAQLVKKKSFTKPFEARYAFSARDFKSIVRLSSPIMGVGSHGCVYNIHYEPTATWIDASGINRHHSVPLFGSEAKPLSASIGDNLDSKTLLLDSSPDSPKWWHLILHQNAYVLHRNQRSEEEFLYRLLRGNANDVAPSRRYRLKTYVSGYTNEGPGLIFDLPEARISDYHRSLDQFIEYCDIAGLIDSARSDLLSIISDFENILPDAISELSRDEQIAVCKRLLAGTSHADFWRQLQPDP